MHFYFICSSASYFCFFSFNFTFHPSFILVLILGTRCVHITAFTQHMKKPFILSEFYSLHEFQNEKVNNNFFHRNRLTEKRLLTVFKAINQIFWILAIFVLCCQFHFYNVCLFLFYFFVLFHFTQKNC